MRGSAARACALQLQGQLHLAVGGHRGQLVVPQVDGARRPRRRARPAARARPGWRRRRCPWPRRASRPAPTDRASRPRRSPSRWSHDHPDADAGRGGRRQRLDLAVVGPDLGLVAPGHVHLDLLAVRAQPATRSASPAARPVRRPAGEAVGAAPWGRIGAHSAVPPMVTPVTRRVACPQPDRDALAVLAARARGHGEVVAHGVDAPQHLGAVADQVGVAERLGDRARPRSGRPRSSRRRSRRWPC